MARQFGSVDLVIANVALNLSPTLAAQVVPSIQYQANWTATPKSSTSRHRTTKASWLVRCAEHFPRLNSEHHRSRIPSRRSLLGDVLLYVAGRPN
jgi:hypothetical protein